MSYRTILLIFSAITVSHCFYLAIAIRSLSSKVTNKLLSIILILFALRTGKSVISLLFRDAQYVTAVVGLLTMSALGPLLFFYVRRLFSDEVPLRKNEYVHFAPGVISLIPVFVIEWRLMSFAYYFFTAHLVIYIMITAIYLWRKKSFYSMDDLQWRWSWYVVLGYALLSISFVVQLLFYDPLTYTMNVVTAAFVVYGLSLYALKRSKLFMAPFKKKLDAGDYKGPGTRILALLEREEIYTDPDLTISKLADRLKIPAYLTSKVINQFFNTSFPELVLRYRLKKAEHLLLTKSEVLSIEGIAYESGFNSLSVFYSSFKKAYKVTPSQYRKDAGLKNGNMKIA
ncbi:MAG: AraC family transcriptional regulator [Bacteroidota bacterium]